MTFTVEAPTSARAAAQVQRALSTAHHASMGSVTAASGLAGVHGMAGDFVDLIEVDGTLLAVLGDVSGKGAPASLVAAVLLSSIQHHAATIGAEPGRLLAAVDASMQGVLDRTGTIVTLVLAALAADGRELRISSAGHHPVLLATGTTSTWIDPTCPPLGALSACTSERRIAFPAGSTLLLASDGLIEQGDLDGTEFGMTGLAASFERSHRDTAGATVTSLMRDVDDHAGRAPQSDDRAVVVIRSGIAA